MYEEHLKNFKDTFYKLNLRYHRYNIFCDFVKMFAISIYNSCAKNQDMEQEYWNTIKKYEKEEQELFSKLCNELLMAYQESNDLTDILGPFYENESLSNKHTGQFFTPTVVSDFMAEMLIADENVLKREIEKYGFIYMNEPTCGAGGMILSFAKALKKRDINYQQDLLVESTDIDSVCAYMTYIQLALYGIPAVVYCGNTLSQKFNFKMETPLFFVNYWKFRKFYTNNSEKTGTNDTESIVEQTNLLKEVIVKGNSQFSLW